jgi:xylan 1,4-beta-xylosidase
MKKIFLAFSLLSLFSISLKAQTGYKNPILPGMYPDPGICKAGDDYYLINSSMGYFPGIPISHSKDLVNWESIGYVLTTKEQLPLESRGGFGGISGGIMAPTIRYHNGTFYVICTNLVVLKIFIVTAKDPKGPWSAPIWIDVPGIGIDPSLFFDDDGNIYMTITPDFTKLEGIRLAQIDVATGKLITPLKSIWNGTGGWSPEGPHIFKKDGWYYLLMAEGGTEYGHKVVIARSKNIDGPYDADPVNPILTHTGRITQNSPIQGVGHPDIVQAADGKWWMVVLAFRHRSMHHLLGRETFIAPVEWGKDEWPVVNKNGTLTLDMNVPTLPQHPYPEQRGRDDFTAPAFGFTWNYVSNPVTANYSLTERPGYLRLKGDTSSITQGKKVTFAGRRQQHENFSATTSLDFKPVNETDEAGLTVFMDYKSHYDLSVKNINGKRMLLLTCNLGMIKHVEKQIALGNGPLELKVEGIVSSAAFSSANNYTFSYSEDGKPYQVISIVDGKYLSTETNGGFTGVYLGLFATGNGQKSVANADFDWFDYQQK